MNELNILKPLTQRIVNGIIFQGSVISLYDLESGIYSQCGNHEYQPVLVKGPVCSKIMHNTKCDIKWF